MTDALQRDLAAVIDGEVRFDRISRALYSTDASVYEIEPLGVVVPRSRDDVLRTVQIAAEHGVPITARGGGTSQAGQAIGAGIVLDTSKYLHRILEINVAEGWARVEPGVVLDELNAQLRPFGVRFAPDVSSASRATIGGMMANNSSGARSIVYGKTIDHVLEQHVVLADGRIAHFRSIAPQEIAQAQTARTIEAEAYRVVRELASSLASEIDRRFPKVLRRVGGYNLDEFVDRTKPVNLARIMVGSEGTLGVVVEGKIRLVPLPATRLLLIIEFAEMLDALAATPLMLRHRPSAVEVMDSFILNHTQQSPPLDALRRSIMSTPDAGAMLCIEFAGDRPEELITSIEEAERDVATSGFRCTSQRVTDPAAQARVWSLREAALGLSMAMRGDAKTISFVEDTAVAPEKLRDYIERFLGTVRRHGTNAGVYAHASVGCLHVRPVINLKTAEGVGQFEAIANDVADLVLEFGGALSGEHGDGLVRGIFTEKMFGPILYDAFRTVKRTFDPDGLFNPGRIVDCPPITSHLRYGAGYRTPDPSTYFDYSEHGGLGRAVEMCSGVGACRKKSDGTMCPSFRATLEEQHTTRGRANVLRLAMNGRLGEAGLGEQGVYDVLDLCLECRACKSECPVGVDVARFKSEFLADYWSRHRTPLRAHAFAHVRSAAKWASRLAPLSSHIAASAAGRWFAEQLLGIDSRRSLPSWTRTTLSRKAAGRRKRIAHPRAMLFADTFTEYAEPDIGIAALDVLDGSGIGAGLAPNGCCGRPLISQGFLSEARALAQANTDKLYDLASSGTAIVFVEPSCLSAVREDAPGLLRGEFQRRARVVADACVLFEEYLERECSAGRAQLALRQGPRRIVLHGHCHQRSMGLVRAAAALLARVPGSHVTDLDAGCCGMAGSFGYTREHYDVSRAIGERKLFPAARDLSSDSVLVAAGTSCRHQVAHFTNAHAVHPAVLLQSLLEEHR